MELNSSQAFPFIDLSVALFSFDSIFRVYLIGIIASLHFILIRRSLREGA